MSLKNRSFLKLLDYTPAEIEELLDLAADLKAKKKAGIRHNEQLAGKNIALIFEKTSTRTRCSFEVAAHDLGMEVTYLDPSGSQIGKKESIADTARVLGGCLTASSTAAMGRRSWKTWPIRRCSGVERPDQRVPPHPDPCRLPDHPGALRQLEGHPFRLLRRCPLQHGQQPDGGLRQDGPALSPPAPPKSISRMPP